MAAAVAVVGVALGLFGATATIASRGGGAEPPTPEQLTQVRLKALEIAKANGESSPRDLRLVVTRRDAAVSLTGGDVPSDARSFAVTMRGDFVIDGPRPYGAAAPTGTALTLVFDASTLEVTDLALTPASPDLARLGDVVAVGR